jgi:Protein of unknown function (DUF3631)
MTHKVPSRGRPEIAGKRLSDLTPPPDPRPIETSELLYEIERFYRRFIVMTDQQHLAVTTWTLHTWVAAAAEATGYLHSTSPTKKSGKTRLLDVATLLVRSPLSTGGASEAALFRSIAIEEPTLLWDEVDTVFSGKKTAENEGKRGILDNGYTRNKPYLRCVGEGSKQSVEKFPVFCPKMLCGIGALPDTVADRCIPIKLKRKTRAEKVERFRERTARLAAAPLRERLEAWADTSIDVLADTHPALPDELDDRAQDVIEPLLAIAELAGGEWPERARKAFIALRGDKDEDEEAIGVRLLADIRDTWAEGVDELSTRSMLENLFEIETSPWADWWAEKEITRDNLGAATVTLVPNRAATMKLARMLKPFGARPHKLKTNVNGYRRADLSDAFTRYVSSSDPDVGKIGDTAQQSQALAVLRSEETSADSDLGEAVSESTETNLQPLQPQGRNGSGDAGAVSLRWPITTHCLVCDADKGARVAAGVTYLACGHMFVAENAPGESSDERQQHAVRHSNRARRSGRDWESPAITSALRARELEQRKPSDDDRPPLSTFPGRRSKPTPGQLDIDGNEVQA